MRQQPVFRRATYEAKVGATVVAVIHCCLASLVALAAVSSHGDQAGVIWVPLLIADFPVSLLGYWGAIGLFRLLPFHPGPLASAVGEPAFFVPALTHIILGSLWYYVLSIALWKCWTAIFKSVDR